MKNIKELEKRADELEAKLKDMYTEIEFADMGGCRELICRSFWEDLDRIQNEINAVYTDLEKEWQKNRESVRADFREMFEKWERFDEEMFAYGYMDASGELLFC